MKYLKYFEAIIVPELNRNKYSIRTMKDLVEYGNQNGFDVVDYDEFYGSLNDIDRKTTPPKWTPFFALFHPIRKRPMFVISDQHILRMPNFKEIVDDIISHEKIHVGQNERSNIEYKLPNPNIDKDYFSNKEEIMAFSWTIANELSKTNMSVKSAFDSLFKEIVNIPPTFGRQVPPRGMHHGPPPSMYSLLWKKIVDSCSDEVINKYKKYIYLYLKNIYEDKIKKI
jgi:hypothetical protein